ncbi:3-oxoacyl-[acyl-carrier-protein] synthase III C-terminal domain-containing protein [Actinorugispora endophytica]|uniref:3-oxoacyl-[acyl-carrier-protein] synthase-3 n=1 Tax=Actinorugispora endophytica TaxID=1605990 RepID=A0A4R6UNF8_9ACTN|nr:3-oxoacyl-[acyl-carrier-protein] synthase III C-terminal domain-containing protein [Actinorugispora endophytica]TDQ48471.1 3-oxoacyl-[acyl-carrier-protein] synthase-3 [Actinorugispora endophytica]
MRLDRPVGVVTAALWLPEGRSTVEAAAGGDRARTAALRDLAHPRLPEARGVSAPDMAVRAARAALDAAGVAGERIGLLHHAWMYYQGHDLWSPPHYIARVLGADRALPVGVRQVCNGGAAAVELAAARLLADPGPGYALVTTADRFVPPGFDRWTADYGVAYGDAGTAVLLRSPGGADDALLLRAVATVAAPELEAMHRGADPFSDAARTHRDRIDMRATKRAYLREHGRTAFDEANGRAVRAVVADALRDAGLDRLDKRIRCAVLPRFGAKVLRESWLPLLTGLLDAEPVDLGRETGHLGAGDAAAGLAALVDGGTLAPGEFALVFSAGAGFTWSCLVVQAPLA